MYEMLTNIGEGCRVDCLSNERNYYEFEVFDQTEINWSIYFGVLKWLDENALLYWENDDYKYWEGSNFIVRRYG